MDYRMFIGSCVATALILILVLLFISNDLYKRRIKKSIIPGTKYVYYNVNGGGNPFLDPNVYITIINIKGNHVLYQQEVKAPELRPSIMEFVDTKALSIPEFVQKIYKLKNVNITLPKH
jgi:hypothetical protein